MSKKKRFSDQATQVYWYDLPNPIAPWVDSTLLTAQDEDDELISSMINYPSSTRSTTTTTTSIPFNMNQSISEFTQGILSVAGLLSTTNLNHLKEAASASPLLRELLKLNDQQEFFSTNNIIGDSNAPTTFKDPLQMAQRESDREMALKKVVRQKLHAAPTLTPLLCLNTALCYLGADQTVTPTEMELACRKVEADISNKISNNNNNNNNFQNKNSSRTTTANITEPPLFSCFNHIVKTQVKSVNPPIRDHSTGKFIKPKLLFARKFDSESFPAKKLTVRNYFGLGEKVLFFFDPVDPSLFSIAFGVRHKVLSKNSNESHAKGGYIMVLCTTNDPMPFILKKSFVKCFFRETIIYELKKVYPGEAAFDSLSRGRGGAGDGNSLSSDMSLSPSSAMKKLSMPRRRQRNGEQLSEDEHDEEEEEDDDDQESDESSSSDDDDDDDSLDHEDDKKQIVSEVPRISRNVLSNYLCSKTNVVSFIQSRGKSFFEDVNVSVDAFQSPFLLNIGTKEKNNRKLSSASMLLNMIQGSQQQHNTTNNKIQNSAFLLVSNNNNNDSSAALPSRKSSTQHHLNNNNNFMNNQIMHSPVSLLALSGHGVVDNSVELTQKILPRSESLLRGGGNLVSTISHARNRWYLRLVGRDSLRQQLRKVATKQSQLQQQQMQSRRFTTAINQNILRGMHNNNNSNDDLNNGNMMMMMNHNNSQQQDQFSQQDYFSTSSGGIASSKFMSMPTLSQQTTSSINLSQQPQLSQVYHQNNNNNNFNQSSYFDDDEDEWR